MKLLLDEMTALYPCASGIEQAKRMVKRGQYYTLEECITVGLPKDSVVWCVLAMADHDPDAMVLLREWAIDCGADGISDASNTQDCMSSVQRAMVDRTLELMETGMPKHSARASAKDECFAKMVNIFRETTP